MDPRILRVTYCSRYSVTVQVVQVLYKIGPLDMIRCMEWHKSTLAHLLSKLSEPLYPGNSVCLWTPAGHSRSLLRASLRTGCGTDSQCDPASVSKIHFVDTNVALRPLNKPPWRLPLDSSRSLSREPNCPDAVAIS